MNYTSKDRPFGITILTIVFALSTLMLLWAFTRMPNSNFGSVLVELNRLGVSPSRAIAGMALEVTLITSCCVGLWTGKKWGWWVTVVYWMYTFVKDANEIRQLPFLSSQLLIPSEQLFSYFVRQNLLALRDILILLYLFKKSVISYFGLSHISRWRLSFQAILIVVIAFILLNFL